MDVRQLRYFVSIAGCESLTQAAEKLGISQPAVGLQVRQLEQEMGVTLLIRHSRGIEVTREGEILATKAREILEAVDTLADTVRGGDIEARGKVRLGLAPSMSLLLSEVLLERAAVDLPYVELELIEATSPMLRQWVADRSIDLALGCEGAEVPGVRQSVLMSEALYLVCRGYDEARATGSETIDFAELSGRHIFLADPMRTGIIQRKLAAAAAKAGVDVRAETIYPSVEMVKLLVEDGRGDTILPWTAIRREYSQKRLHAARIVNPELHRDALLLTNRVHALSVTQTAVCNLLEAVIAETRALEPTVAFAMRRAAAV